jgi:hypothetical protein
MSALGQKPTCAPQKVMSALHPIATSIAYLYDGGPLRPTAVELLNLRRVTGLLSQLSPL